MIHPRPRWSPSLHFGVNEFQEVGETHLALTIEILEQASSVNHQLAAARLVEVAYQFQDGGRHYVDGLYQDAIDALIDDQYGHDFLLRLVIPWINERHNSGRSINRIANNINRVASLAYSRQEGELFPLARIPPQYPIEALRRREEGNVCLQFTLAADGTPQGVAAFSDDHPRSLEASAIEALEQFIYAPQMRDGQPVAVEGVRFCFDFRISR